MPRQRKKGQSEGDFLTDIALSAEDKETLERARSLLFGLEKKYGVSSESLFSLLDKDLSFPDSVLSEKITLLHSVVKFLKENKQMSLHDIGLAINRDERNVWRIYHDTHKRHPEPFVIAASHVWIPVSILRNEVLSAQEALVSHLKIEGMSLHEIALLMKRDDRTIWTVYRRSLKKYGEKTKNKE